MSHIEIETESRPVEIRIDGEVVARTDRPVVLREGDLPPRIYFDPADVRTDLLEPSDLTTFCPYKGTASYRSVRIGDAVHTDVIWTYPDPIDDVADIAGLLAFYDHRVETVVGEVSPADRPPSPERAD